MRWDSAHDEQRVPEQPGRAEAPGDRTEAEASEDAGTPDHADQRCGRHLGHATALCVPGDEHERYEQSEGDEQGGGVQEREGANAQQFAERAEALGVRRRRSPLRHGAGEQEQTGTGDRVDDERGAPTRGADEGGSQGRAHQRPQTDAGDRHAQRSGTAVDEPATHRRHHGDVAARHRQPDAHAVRHVADDDRRYDRGEEQPGSERGGTDPEHRPRPQPVGQRPVTGASANDRLIVMENTSAVAPDPVPNSSDIDSKNAPKL
jgi:hypothetical protein